MCHHFGFGRGGEIGDGFFTRVLDATRGIAASTDVVTRSAPQIVVVGGGRGRGRVVGAGLETQVVDLEM